jgi:hypothetical protein
MERAMRSSDPGERLTSLARRWAPHLEVLSVSQPEPHLEQFNVVATTSDADKARAAVLQLEAEENDDARIGLVVLGAPTDEREPTGVDPEGLGRTIAPRIVTGGAIGAVVGASVGGAVAAISGGAASVIVGAALAGAVLLALVGAIWATFARLGASDAYRQTFVDETATGLNVVSLHTDEEAEAERAIARLTGQPDLVVRLLDSRGSPVPSRSDD